MALSQYGTVSRWRHVAEHMIRRMGLDGVSMRPALY